MRTLLLLLCATGFSPAQELQVYSELQRSDPNGRVLSRDRATVPREIISPAVARNGFASFHVVVSGPQGMNYFLYVMTNPPDIVQAKLYKETFEQSGGEWIPDTLEETRSPHFGVIPEGRRDLADQTARSYLLDIWVPPDAQPGRRVRLEVLMKVGGWVVAPMELRVVEAMIPVAGAADSASPLPPVSDPADSATTAPLLGYLTGASAPAREQHPHTVRGVIRRNAEQDMALARAFGSPDPWLRAGRHLAAGWMLLRPDQDGAEWYLRLRDALYRWLG